MKSFGKKTVSALLTIAVVGLAANIRADDETSAQGASFSGKATEVDKSSKTLAVGNRTFQALPTTQVTRQGKAAKFEDIEKGEKLSGRYKKSAEGKLELLSLDLSGRAKSTEAAGGTRESAETSEAGAAFSGKATKVDKSSKTLTVGNRTFQALPTTQVTRQGKAAKFEDIKKGEELSGRYKKSAEDKLELLSLDLSGTAKSDATGGTKEDEEASEAGAAFSGKISKIDKSAQTFTIGRRTYQLLPTTRMLKADNAAASIDDLKVGQQVSGRYKKSTEGKYELLTLDVGKKGETQRERQRESQRDHGDHR